MLNCYSRIVENYLEQIKEDIGKYSGRAFWTGKSGRFVSQPMGKNMFFTIPRDMAKVVFDKLYFRGQFGKRNCP